MTDTAKNMIVMPSNNRGMVAGWLCGRFPRRIGHLYSPGAMARTYDWLPYALDNGRYPCWSSGKAWDEHEFLGLLDRARGGPHQPLWCLVPDVVGDKDGTLRQWDAWATRLSRYGWPLAFAVQDGMDGEDVPDDAQVVFVGGSTDWKRRTMHGWCSEFPRVHVGRINTSRWLWECDEAGAESCDGTGWFRGDQDQLHGLVQYLERSEGGCGNPEGGSLFATDSSYRPKPAIFRSTHTDFTSLADR